MELGGSALTKGEQFERMRAALKNILDISSCEFAKSQAHYGLCAIKTDKSRELENKNEEVKH